MFKLSINNNGLAIGIVVVLAFALGIWFGIDKQDEPARIIVQDRIITVLPKPKMLNPFLLQTATGKPFTLESIQNKYTILFFGYTSCPDICPTTLHVLRKMYDKLEKTGEDKGIQVVFVSVDPGRDKPEKLQKYVSYFNKKFIGVTGSAKEISKFANQLSAAYEVMDYGKTENYGVNHTGLLFITNPKAQYAAILSPPHESDLILSRLKLLKQLEKHGEE